MNQKNLLKVLNNNAKLTRPAIIHYLSLLCLAVSDPYPSDAYIATKVTSNELEKLGLLAGNVSPLNALLIKEGLIKRLEGQEQSVYILGEKHKVKTLAGDKVAQVWYFENGGEEIKHDAKEKKSKAKTYNSEFKEILDFYWGLYEKKYGRKPLYSPSVMQTTKKTLRQLPFRVVKACLIPYMELDDDYLENRKYPLEILGYKISKCRDELYDKMAYYEMTGKDDEFFEKYINKVIKDKKLTAHEEWLKDNNGGTIAKQNRERHPKPTGGE